MPGVITLPLPIVEASVTLLQLELVLMVFGAILQPRLFAVASAILNHLVFAITTCGVHHLRGLFALH